MVKKAGVGRDRDRRRNSLPFSSLEAYNDHMAHKDTKRRSISSKQRLEILQRDGYVCGYCPDRKRRKPSSLVVDHIIPVKDGGYHGPENWVSACRSCNRRKWLYSPNEEGAPRLRWFGSEKVAKTTTMGKKFRKRVPVISFRRH